MERSPLDSRGARTARAVSRPPVLPVAAQRVLGPHRLPIRVPVRGSSGTARDGTHVFTAVRYRGSVRRYPRIHRSNCGLRIDARRDDGRTPGSDRGAAFPSTCRRGLVRCRNVRSFDADVRDRNAHRGTAVGCFYVFLGQSLRTFSATEIPPVDVRLILLGATVALLLVARPAYDFLRKRVIPRDEPSV